MQRLGQLILCLILLLAVLFGISPALGAAPATINLSLVTHNSTPVTSLNPAQLVPLALMLIFATLILLSTPRDSGQDQ